MCKYIAVKGRKVVLKNFVSDRNRHNWSTKLMTKYLRYEIYLKSQILGEMLGRKFRQKF